jgi:hypothetical protein
LSLGSVHTTSYPAWLDKVSTLGGIGISGILAKNNEEETMLFSPLTDFLKEGNKV